MEKSEIRKLTLCFPLLFLHSFLASSSTRCLSCILQNEHQISNFSFTFNRNSSMQDVSHRSKMHLKYSTLTENHLWKSEASMVWRGARMSVMSLLVSLSGTIHLTQSFSKSKGTEASILSFRSLSTGAELLWTFAFSFHSSLPSSFPESRYHGNNYFTYPAIQRLPSLSHQVLQSLSAFENET